jgi:hypothetical protein
MWTKLQRILARIIASTDTEVSLESIAYHEAERAGELRFSRSSSLCRFY